jgi:hypothetical protein
MTVSLVSPLLPLALSAASMPSSSLRRSGSCLTVRVLHFSSRDSCFNCKVKVTVIVLPCRTISLISIGFINAKVNLLFRSGFKVKVTVNFTVTVNCNYELLYAHSYYITAKS